MRLLPFELAFTLKICKLCHTELKDNFKEDTAMLQISEIIKKTEEMFDLFNKHFYNKELMHLACL